MRQLLHINPIVAASLLLVAVSTHLATAQTAEQKAKIAEVQKLPGRWDPLEFTAAREVPTAQRAVMKREGDEILALFRRVPPLSPPIGFTLTPRVRVSALSDEPGHPLVMTVLLFTEDHGLTWGNKASTHGHTDLGAVLTNICANDLACLFPTFKDPVLTDDAGPMFAAPRRVADFHGYPAYAAPNGDFGIVLTKRSAPLVVPVSLERVIRHNLADARAAVTKSQAADAAIPEEDRQALAQMKATIAEIRANKMGMPRAQVDTIANEMQKQADGLLAQRKAARAQYAFLADSGKKITQRRVSMLEKLLATKSRAELDAPATVGDHYRFVVGKADLAPEEMPAGVDAIQLVSPNPAFFDRRLASTDLQLLIVFGGDDSEARRSHMLMGTRARKPVFDALDWTALAALLSGP